MNVVDDVPYGRSEGTRDELPCVLPQYTYPAPYQPTIHFSSSSRCCSGQNTYVFSNFHAAPYYSDEGVYYWCSEQEYQEGKARYHEQYKSTQSDPNGPTYSQVRQVIMNETAATRLASAGRSLSMNDACKQAWAENKAHLLLQVTRHKYYKCRLERQYLLGTGNREIVEATKDRICGTGYADKNAADMEGYRHAESHRDKWGSNLVGCSLMQVRHELRQKMALNPNHFDEINEDFRSYNGLLKHPQHAFVEGTFDVAGSVDCQQQQER
ncbi:hypothetical protein BAUCODRAFT_300137 [Baudoinia panamericana UAMH 10762]|uniref:NADAR domain-containing protein n=1 Tax=Baudoinia panamericana (strain UAMH 10762) TaxID=717646 RepID=M2MZ96_BAUPA|nr:uncharacterized protein BAUCODRAFT_300137 [Baudoinia panamericana UAMH 10762]EMC91650.1 hypothetical protein BAUCODRAFT_300137 [Baudoinia panamericana UAMH 10762]